MKNIHKINNNIYITSDEEIKEEGYVFWEGKVYKYREFMKMRTPVYTNYFSIILTTDQDLIKDGVQPIPNDFLEWFVKNPNCEEVEIEKEYKHFTSELYDYKIIIPKEEWKCCGAFYGCDKCEHKKELRGIPKGKIDMVVGKPKQSTKDRILYETPESIKQKVRETANKLVKPKQEPKPFKDMQQLTEVDFLNKSLKKGIGVKREFVINTSKWNLEDFEETKDLTYYRANAEEDYMKVPISVLRYISELEKRSYSEEEVLELLQNFNQNAMEYIKEDEKSIMTFVTLKKWFEQFKKKIKL
jgi:hypothetical protein